MTKYTTQAQWRKTHPEKWKEIRKKQTRELKTRVIAAYGGKCECCQEERIEFLCIDHINGCGNEERKKHGLGSNFYYYLVRENFPEGYRVLCHNCNMSYGSYGYCPHNVIIGYMQDWR